jgi:hypothetical protein
MEKLHLIKRILIILTICSSTYSHSQNGFFVYKAEGNPTLKIHDSIKPISKGIKIRSNSIVTINSQDVILLINKIGELFKISSKGKYTFLDLKNLKPIKEKTSFTEKYFTYVWNEFTKNAQNKSKGGVIYRTDHLTLMLQPADSLKIYFPEIRFSWSQQSDENKGFYFILKDTKTSKITKIGTDTTSLTLFVDNNILSRGNTYQWTVSSEKYPNFEEIKFYSFELLNSQQFKNMQSEIGSITIDLKKLGFTDTEIKMMLCEDYKVCF